MYITCTCVPTHYILQTHDIVFIHGLGYVYMWYVEEGGRDIQLSLILLLRSTDQTPKSLIFTIDCIKVSTLQLGLGN